MPFRLCNAPASLERMVDALLRSLKWSTCLCYLDDVTVFSPTFKDHLQRLATVFSLFRSADVPLNSSKCHFGSRGISVLWHLLNAAGIQPDAENVRAVRNFPVPCPARDVRSFMELWSYLRRFVKGLAYITRSLTYLLKKDAPYFWGTQQVT